MSFERHQTGTYNNSVDDASSLAGPSAPIMKSVGTIPYNSDEVQLASLGYKQELKREFRLFEVFGFAFTLYGLLPSIASVLSISASNGGAVSMVWGWAVGLCFILCIGLSMAELASSAPTSGGLYYMTHSLSSPRYRNVLCWIVGYANTIGMVTGVAAVNWACTSQIAAAAAVGSSGRIILTNGQSYGIFSVLILSEAVVCSFGTKLLGRLQSIYVFANIMLCLVVIVALPIATPKELKNSASYVFGDFTNFSGWPDGLAFSLGLLTPLWTVCGYDSVIHMSEESHNPAIAAPWGIVISIVIAGVLGWVINVMLAFCMGPDLAGVLSTPGSQPMVQIFLNSFGTTWTLVIWSFVIIVQYMVCTTGVLVASRQSFAFARDGALPLSNILYQVNAYTGTPVNTVLFDCLFALLVGLLVFLDSAAINAVFTASVTAFYVAYMVPITARFIFDNNFKPGPFSLGVLGAPVATIAVMFMAFMLVIFFFPANPGPNPASMNYSSLVLGGVILFAVVWYYLPVYGAVHWFHGPTRNVEQSTSSPVSVGSATDAIVEEKIGKDDGIP